MNKKMKKLVKKNKKQILNITFIALVIIVVTVIGLYAVPSVNNSIRKNRIVSIYNSLNLDANKYSPNYESVFGEKKIYDYDLSRSFSSEITYIRSANVDTTVAELKQAISQTDFTFYEEPYPGSSDFKYIYKSPRNEYMRVSVTSKTSDDEYFNKYSMGLSASDMTADRNAGPSNVSIKINLDDNNE